MEVAKFKLWSSGDHLELHASASYLVVIFGHLAMFSQELNQIFPPLNLQQNIM